MKTFAKYQLPLIIWAMIIFILSSLQGIPHIETVIISSDKLAHISMYFIFCWLAYRAFFYQDKSSFLKRWAIVGAFLIACVYGYLDEIHQSFVPGREYDVYDMLANAIGAGLFVLVFVYVRKRQ